MDEVQVENIIAAFSVSSSLDLSTLANVLPDVKYEPNEVPAIILNLSKPRCMVTLFPSGKAVLTGAKSMDDAAVIVQMVLTRLTVVGVPVQSSPEIQVQNVTGSIDLHQPLDLSRLAKHLQNVEYNPKIFPGLVYKENDPNTVILLFDSGKIIGNSTSLDAMTVALNNLIEKLVSFGISKEEFICRK